MEWAYFSNSEDRVSDIESANSAYTVLLICDFIYWRLFKGFLISWDYVAYRMLRVSLSNSEIAFE
jgi:hypothetical protein